jgi:hypothetical protein
MAKLPLLPLVELEQNIPKDNGTTFQASNVSAVLQPEPIKLK